MIGASPGLGKFLTLKRGAKPIDLKIYSNILNLPKSFHHSGQRCHRSFLASPWRTAGFIISIIGPRRIGVQLLLEHGGLLG